MADDPARDERLYFDAIKERRDGYFVEYRPPAPEHDFAMLSLVFVEPIETRRVSDLMRAEMQFWLRRYPVPLMISAFDVAENLIGANDGQNIHLVGWRPRETDEVLSSWKLEDLSEFLSKTPQASDWRAIYTDVGFKTESQVKAKADKNIKEYQRQIRSLRLILGLWLCVVPAAWAVIQYLGPDWLALAVMIFGLAKARHTWLKITGRSKPSAAEVTRADKKRKMEHYYYHCERNPDGFVRLKAENFNKDLSENTRREAAELAEPGTPNRSLTEL